jgi:hypothetical protein
LIKFLARELDRQAYMQCNWSRKEKDAGYLISDAVKTGFKSSINEFDLPLKLLWKLTGMK